MPTADILTTKLLLNSVIFTPKTKFMTIDIKHLYFNTPLKRYEYLQQKLADMPKDVKRQYEFAEKATYDG